MKVWLLNLFTFFTTIVLAQNISDFNDGKLRVQLHGAIGKSFMGGGSYGVGGEFLYRLNQLGYRYNNDLESVTILDSDPPSLVEGAYVGYQRSMQSNNFYYGRSIQKNRLIGTGRIGFSQLTFRDATYTTDSVAGNWLFPAHVDYTINYYNKYAYGLFVETEGTVYFWRYMGTGLRVYFNFNKLHNYGGFQLYLSFFIGPK